MNRADFYVLESTDDQARRLFACKLTEKAYRNGLRVFILTSSSEEADRLDELLWTYRQGSFVPHALDGKSAAADTPVVVGVTPPTTASATDMLVNLSEHLPAQFEHLARIAELVDSVPARRNAARERYRYYKERHVTLETHQITS